jgi:hypothetical protein
LLLPYIYGKQRSRGSKVQGSEVQGFIGWEVQGFIGWEVQDQRFRVQGFRVQRLGGSAFWV